MNETFQRLGLCRDRLLAILNPHIAKWLRLNHTDDHTIAYGYHHSASYADTDTLSAGAGDQRGYAGGLHPADSDGFPVRDDFTARTATAGGRDATL